MHCEEFGSERSNMYIIYLYKIDVYLANIAGANHVTFLSLMLCSWNTGSQSSNFEDTVS